MTHILNIETSTQVCSVSLAGDGKVIALRESFEKNSHAENVTIFCEEVVNEAGLEFKNLDAVAVSKGPGSYTGLRIGVSTAKGYCYALDIPLIAIGTLKSLAKGMISKVEEPQDALFIPLLDARRMEVYSQVLDGSLNQVREIRADIIDQDSFQNYLEEYPVYFAGDGADKCRPLLENHRHAHFLDSIFPSSANMSKLSYNKFIEGDIEDLAYFEPFYLKDFVAGIPRVKGLK